MMLLARVSAILLVMLLFPLSFFPLKTGEIFGLLLYHLWGSKRRIARENIEKSTLFNVLGAGNAEDVIRENFRNIGRSFIEVVKVYFGKGRGIMEEVTIIGREHYDRAREKGKGVIFITGHCGNWELMALASSYRSETLSVVARPLNNPYLNRLLERARARFGNEVLYKKGALRGIISALKRGGCVGILMDQAVLPNEGYIIDFLGRGAWTTKMPALIARKTGAPVLPVFIRKSGRGHEIIVHPEVQLSEKGDIEEVMKEDTQRFSRYIEEFIRQSPAEWLWLHRRWKRVPQ
jgi:KDO2-lipid IV(A) lauroyltransferase